MTSDEKLYREYLERGCESSFSILHQRHFSNLVSFVFNRYIRDRATAEDVAQHAFMTACSSGHTYDPSRPFVKWLFTIAGNWAIRQTTNNNRKKSGGGKTIVSFDRAAIHTVADTRGDSDETTRSIYQAVQSLPADERDVIVRLYYENASERDVSEELNITRHRVRTLAAAGISHMRQAIEGELSPMVA